MKKNYETSRKLASQGMVLLKNNERILPLSPTDKVGVIGKECLDLINGGGGSAKVNCEYIRSLVYGLEEKAGARKIVLERDSIALAETVSEYDVDILNELAEKTDKCIVTYKRYGREHADRKVFRDQTLSEKRYQEAEEDGYFYPSKEEEKLFANIESSNIENVILILNVSSIVDFSFINKYPKIKAVLLTYLPGMESGTAIADVLCGDVNPSGKLTDTVAYSYDDYPSSKYFNYDKYESKYKEGIFLGYRYFETYAKDKVLYPFGFGLSYTQFDYSNYSVEYVKNNVIVNVIVENVGKYSGREVVQVYQSAPKGRLKKPVIELRGYTKTKELKPGETEKVSIMFPIKALASYDAEGATGKKASWVIEQGEHKLYVGKSIRDLYPCGSFNVTDNIVTEQLQNRFDGSQYEYHINDFTNDKYNNKELYTLYDVQDGSVTLHDFVNQLNEEELVSLSLGQPLAFARGTSGVGNLKKYKVPNAQTADGPAGIRRYVNTTCFPCATLIACSWDKDLQFAMGAAMGYEGYTTDLDILLAPAMNLHRNPLCGRNFEYFSEDPLVTGKTAAALVNGMQSEGLCATIKHFAANNCEDFRNVSNSIVDERTLRELYLKAFEIAIKESNPAYVMTAYNLLNGVHTSAHAQLLRGVLRDEWKYEGATMTDWRNGVPLVDEILAGNNIKMPVGYPDEGEKVLQAYYKGEIPLKMLRENAYFVLKSIMKTRSFEQKDFGVIHEMKGTYLDIPVMKVNGLASARINHSTREDGVEYLWQLNREQRNQRSYVYYAIVLPQSGMYHVSLEISTNCPETQIWFLDKEEKRIGTAYCDKALDETKWYTVEADILLNEGENILKLVFANEPYKEYEFYNPGPEVPNAWPEVAKEDIRFAKMSIELCSSMKS